MDFPLTHSNQNAYLSVLINTTGKGGILGYHLGGWIDFAYILNDQTLALGYTLNMQLRL